jgi:hypothetical protein
MVPEPIDYQRSEVHATWSSEKWRRSRAGQFAAWMWLVGAYFSTVSAILGALVFWLNGWTSASFSIHMEVALILVMVGMAPTVIFGLAAGIHRRLFLGVGRWTMAVAGVAAGVYVYVAGAVVIIIFGQFRGLTLSGEYAMICVPALIFATFYSPVAVAYCVTRVVAKARASLEQSLP